MGTIRSYDKQMRHLAHLLIGGGKKDGKKKLCSYYADKCLSCSDSLCANGVSRAEWHRAPESDGGGRQTSLSITKYCYISDFLPSKQ